MRVRGITAASAAEEAVRAKCQIRSTATTLAEEKLTAGTLTRLRRRTVTLAALCEPVAGSGRAVVRRLTAALDVATAGTVKRL